MVYQFSGYALDSSVAVDPRGAIKLSIPAGQTGRINGTAFHADGSPYSLTACQLLMTWERSGVVVLSLQATIDNASTGTFHFLLDVGDSIDLLGGYAGDIWLTDATVDPNKRYRLDSGSVFSVVEANGQPGQDVTVGASQTPLALGPKGDKGDKGDDGAGSTLSDDAAAHLAASGAAGTSTDAARSDHVHPTLPLATQSLAGFLAALDKKRVDGVTMDLVADFGADPTGVVNMIPSWNAAMAFFWTRNLPGGKLRMRGIFKASSDVHLTAPCVIEGEGGGLIPQTKINLAAGASFIVHSFGSALAAGFPSGHRAEGSVLKDFALFGTVPPIWQANHTPAVGDVVVNTQYVPAFTQLVYVCTAVSGPTGSNEPTWPVRDEMHGWNTEGVDITDGGVTWKSRSSPGIWMKGTAVIDHVYCESIPGDGLYPYGYIVGDPTGESDCSAFSIRDFSAQECLGRWVYAEGTDAQGGRMVGGFGQNCNSGGIYDNTDVGNVYKACLTETNGLSIWGPTGFTVGAGVFIAPQLFTMDAMQDSLGDNPFYYVSTVGGTSGGTEPTWPTTIGDTVSDGTITWKCAGRYTYGQSLKNRRAGTNGSLFLGCYEEPDQRLSEIDLPGQRWGSIGGQLPLQRNMGGFDLINGRRCSSLTYVSKESTGTRIMSTLGTQSSDPIAFEFSRIDGFGGYQWKLGQVGLGGTQWVLVNAGEIAMWLTTEDCPEGPGRAVFFDGLHLGNGFGNTPTAGAAMNLNAISQLNGQSLPDAANLGDFIFNRDAGVGQPIGWVCTTGATSGAVWTPVDASKLPYTPTTASDWAGTPPASTQESLDRIAAALNALGHKP